MTDINRDDAGRTPPAASASPGAPLGYTPVPGTNTLPIGIAAGSLFSVDGRTVRLERVNDDGSVELRDQRTMGLVQVKDPETGGLSASTLDWMREKYREGTLHALDPAETPADRQGRYALLDPDACVDRDPKSRHRFSLANRAEADGVKLTDAANSAWLDDNYGREKSDLEFPKPGGSSLRRWRSTLRKKGNRQGVLVSQTGRPRGSSQLDAVRDAIVHEAALFYWTRPEAEQKHAFAWMEDQVAKLNEKLPRDEQIKAPSREALRLRIHRLRCHDTVKAKHGQKEADRLFVGSDQAITAVDLLEIGLMDATTLEQVVVFDDDWTLPACRIRITALMDLRSHAITGAHVYAGPNRAETSIETIIASMTPPDVPVAMAKRHPMLAWMFGKYAKLLPDNEKALIGPSTLPSINEIGIDVMPAPVGMPTAKAALERFWRTLKDALRQVPGTIIDPRRAKELDLDDAVDAACLTLPQLRALVAQVVAAYNSSPCRGLDGQSPALVWERLVRKRATRGFEDIGHVRRVLGRNDTALLTFDGVEKHGIRYRDAAAVTCLLDNLAHTQAVRGRRKDGTITVEVTIRISPGNLDSIQVWDEVASEWIVLPSTQPRYTHQLSEWEHREFTRMAAKRNEPFSSEADRLQSKRETMRMIDEMAPKLPFQQRRNMAALYLSQQVKTLAGSAADEAPPIPLDEVGPATMQATMETGRPVAGAPADAAATGDGERAGGKRPSAPDRGQAAGDCQADAEADVDWDDVEIVPPVDREIGHEPPVVDDRWTESEA